MLPFDLYRRIYEVMPIACVDLLVTVPGPQVLMLRRRNEPAAGQWWFPGGRVLHGERRSEAAVRKLREEVGLHGGAPVELLTEDLLFNEKVDAPRHGISTVFHFRFDTLQQARTDDQSAEAQWQTPKSWMNAALHPFIRRVLGLVGPLYE